MLKINSLGLAASIFPLHVNLRSSTPAGILGAGISYSPTNGGAVGLWGNYASSSGGGDGTCFGSEASVRVFASVVLFSNLATDTTLSP